jgi:hypothetical protein
MTAKVLSNAVCSTRLWRFQFGVSPHCVDARVIAIGRTKNETLPPRMVSGVTLETTRGTRVLPTFSEVLPHIGDEFHFE